MKLKKSLYLVMALICAVIAAGSIYFYLEELEAEAREATEYDQVLVAEEDIPPRTRVSPDMFKEKDFPTGYVHPQALESSEEISEGITTTALHSGEQVLEGNLAREGEAEDGFAYTISEGKRALAVSVDQVVAVGGLLLPGDQVDVIATLDTGEEDDGGRKPTSQVIIENVKVLSVGQNYDQHASEEAVGEAQTVNLEVHPDEAPTLTLATEEGNIRLMLRSPVDEESVQPDSWDIEDF